VLAMGLGVKAARALEAASPAASTAPRAAVPAVAAPGSAADALAKRLAALRHKVLRDEDFVENEEMNRDPFHPYLRVYVENVAPVESKKVAPPASGASSPFRLLPRPSACPNQVPPSLRLPYRSCSGNRCCKTQIL